MVAFEVLLVTYLNTPSAEISYKNAFAPLFLWLSFWVVGGCGMGGVLYKDGRDRRRNIVHELV